MVPPNQYTVHLTNASVVTHYYYYYYTLCTMINRSRQWLSRSQGEDYQNCSVLYCVLKLCTVRSTLRYTVLIVLWIGFYRTWPISLCTDLCLCLCTLCSFFLLHVLCYCNTTGWTWCDWSLNLRTLSSFSALTLLVGSFDNIKPIPDMTYNVAGGSLKLTQPQLQHSVGQQQYEAHTLRSQAWPRPVLRLLGVVVFSWWIWMAFSARRELRKLLLEQRRLLVEKASCQQIGK